jgi:hypothetical protein
MARPPRWWAARRVLWAGALLLAACEPPTALLEEAAYDATALSGGRRYRWASGRVVRVWVEGAPMSGAADLARAVRSAEQGWNAVPAFAEVTLAPARSLAEAQVVVLDPRTPLPVVPAPACPYQPRSAAGYTYLCPGDGQALRLPMADGRVGAATVSVVIGVDVGRFAQQAALDAVVAHELGHALGIAGHSDLAADLMFGAPAVADPSARDARTLRRVLASPADFLL